MKIIIKVRNEVINIDIEDTKTILDLKGNIVEKLVNFNPKPTVENICLIFNGSKLKDEAAVNSVLSDGVTVHGVVMKKQEETKENIYEKSPSNMNNMVGGMPYGGMPYGGMPAGGMPTGGMPYGGMPYGGMPYGGMPYGMSPNMSFMNSFKDADMSQMLDTVLENPALLDFVVGQIPGINTNEDKEKMKETFVSRLKEIKEKNPELLKTMMNSEFMRSMGMNPMHMNNMWGSNPYMNNPNMGSPNMGSPGIPPPYMYQPMYPQPPYYGYYQPPPQNINYEEMYKRELAQLEEMGYNNKEQNIRALRMSNGDINVAANIIADENNKTKRSS